MIRDKQALIKALHVRDKRKFESAFHGINAMFREWDGGEVREVSKVLSEILHEECFGALSGLKWGF